MKTGSSLVLSSLVAPIAYGQVVQWDIAKREPLEPLEPLEPQLDRRQAQSIEEIINNDRANGGYFATCKIGTPGQDVTLQLDTGSSDIWVPSTDSGVCRKSKTSDGCTLGALTSADSSTFQDAGKGDFSISYVDGSSAEGDYFTDVFEIGNTAISNMTMGLGLQTNIPYGLVGVGYALNEASTDKIYPNLPVNMQQEGLISTVAYSLWLNDLDASTGNILFGGIDTKKYQGDLTRIKVYEDPRTKAFTSFIVALTSLEAASNSGSDELSSQEFPVPVVLDSGTTLSYLPTDLATEIWKEVGAVYMDEVGSALIPCSRANTAGHFAFGFAGVGGPAINVTMDELVLPLTSGDEQPTFPSGQYEGLEACNFGIQNLSSTPYLLGDTFLRSAYVVYDLVNNEIGLAPTDFNATESNIVPFESKGAPIPSATAAPSQDSIQSASSSTSSTSTYGASNGFQENQENEEKKENSASIPPIFDWSKMAVVSSSILFTVTGAGLLY